MPIIESRGLSRRFKTRRGIVEAVADLDLTIDEGEIVGFLGPNGAGKTTTFRMLTTLLRPTAGTATVAGADLADSPEGVRASIGYVPQAVGSVGGGSDPNATVREELVLQGRLYHRSAAQAARRADELIERLDLTGLDRRLTKTLSGGQRRRLDVALGLAHSPRIVFLDEPSTGLDPQSRGNLWEHIRRLRDELGTTVFLSTHYLDEADTLCDRVLVIDHGKIVAQGSPDELKRQILGDIVTFSVAGDPAAALDALADLTDLALSGSVLRMTVPHGEKALPDLLRRLDAAGVALTAVQMVRPTLDDVFLTLTGRGLRDGWPANPGQPTRAPELEGVAG